MNPLNGHFKDFKRTLYGEGCYRLCGKYKKCFIPRNVWKKLDEGDRKTVLRFRQKWKILEGGEAGLCCISLFQFHSTCVECCKETWTEIQVKENESEHF